MQSKPSKPQYYPVLTNGTDNSFAIVKGPINGHNGKEVVFYRLLDSRTSFTYIFQEIDDFVEDAVQEGEVAPEEKEELIRRCRISIARWARH